MRDAARSTPLSFSPFAVVNLVLYIGISHLTRNTHYTDILDYAVSCLYVSSSYTVILVIISSIRGKTTHRGGNTVFIKLQYFIGNIVNA